MPSKRASAMKAAKASEAIADRMEAIERNQALIMGALGIVVPSDDEAEVGDGAEDAPSEVSDSPEGASGAEGDNGKAKADAGKEDTGSKSAPAKKVSSKK